MSNYDILVNILEQIKAEAPLELTIYHALDNELSNQARSRAFIHLYLKANNGLLDFAERENYITDGTNDGGIDGYFIDTEAKVIYFVQSKFRMNENNFEKKEITIEEILKMEIDRVLSGETNQENGVRFNGKVLSMQRRINSLPDLVKYRYEVTILANVATLSPAKLRVLTSGLPVNIFDYRRTFSELVFPVVSGTFYNGKDLTVKVNLNNKSSGAHINYEVETAHGSCDITILFLPLSEVGKLMFTYKNSILKYNPRSYLTLKEGSVNSEIKNTVVNGSSNEFALFNNGITMLSNDTVLNHRIGERNKALLSILNPQIINGGQTAFTLSLLYEEAINGDTEMLKKLEEKEVLVKIITFDPAGAGSYESKLDLVESISTATNKQTEVNNADRSSNNPLWISSQASLFLDFGLLLERKRGEFYDGLRLGYINKSQVIDRGIFMRIAFSTLGYTIPPRKEKQLLTDAKINLVLNDTANIKRYVFGCLIYSELELHFNKQQSESSKTAIFSIIAVSVTMFYRDTEYHELKVLASQASSQTLKKWSRFEDYIVEQFHNNLFFNYNYNYSMKTFRLATNFQGYYKSNNLAIDLNDFFFDSKKGVIEDKGSRRKLKTKESFLGHFLTMDLMRAIRPYINSTNWFDEDAIAVASEKLNTNPRTIRTAIKLVTSKEYGYYYSEETEIQLPIPTKLGERLSSTGA